MKYVEYMVTRHEGVDAPFRAPEGDWRYFEMCAGSAPGEIVILWKRNVITDTNDAAS